MSSLYLQYNNLPQWLLSWFYYLQFKVAHLFHVTDVQRFNLDSSVATSVWNHADDGTFFVLSTCHLVDCPYGVLQSVILIHSSCIP